MKSRDKRKAVVRRMVRNKPQGFDFRNVFPLRKHMLGSSATLLWNSNQLMLSAQAEANWNLCCLARGVSMQSPFIKIEPWAEEDKAVVGRPVMKGGPDTLPVRHLNGGRSVSIDMSLLFAVKPFPVKHRTKAYIPVSIQDLPDLGTVLIFHLGKAEGREIGTDQREGLTRRRPAGPQTGSHGDQP